jgi:hypothetical protein
MGRTLTYSPGRHVKSDTFKPRLPEDLEGLYIQT